MPPTKRHARVAGSRVRIALLPLLLAPALAHAWVLDWALGTGLEYSDNIRRVRDGEQSDFIVVPRAEFRLTEEGTRVQVEALGSAEYRHYLDGTFDDELRAELAARANFVVVPERLSWTVEDYLAQEPIDIFAADRPDNTQRVNVFVTGPTMRFRLAPATFLQAELRYIDTWAEESGQFNGRRYAAAARFMRETSATSRISLHAEAQRARFDEDTLFSPDFDRYDVYGRHEREGARLKLSGDIGYSVIEFDRGDDVGAPLLRGAATWELSSVSTLDLLVASRYADTAQDIISATPATSLGRPLPLTEARRSTVTSDVFEDRRVEAGYSRQGVRTFMRAGLYAREQDYENVHELDTRGRGVAFDVSYRLSERQTLSGFAYGESRDFTTLDRDDRDRVIGVRWRWQWRSRIVLGAEVAHASRDSSDPLQEFDELRALLTLTLTRNGA